MPRYARASFQRTNLSVYPYFINNYENTSSHTYSCLGHQIENFSILFYAPGGEIALIGVLTRSGKPIEFGELIGKANIRQISVVSRKDFEAMNRFIAAHQMVPVIDRVFPLEQAPDAFRYLENQRFVGKIVIAH